MKTPPIFSDIKLTWKGEERLIPTRRVMMCIAEVEEHVTLVDLTRFQETRSFPFAKLAMAYAVILKHAGLRVSQEEVYAEMFKPEGDAQQTAVVAVQTILMMMLPPSLRQKLSEGDEEVIESAPQGKPLTSTAET